MSKNLINSEGDFFHLYIGCDVIVTPYEGASYQCKLTGVMHKRTDFENQIRVQVFEADDDEGYEGAGIQWFDEDEVELLLRPIIDMTEDEAAEFIHLKGRSIMCNIDRTEITRIRFGETKNIIDFSYKKQNEVGSKTYYVNQSDPEQFNFLLSRGFDLFGLIKKGFATDSTQRVGVN